MTYDEEFIRNMATALRQRKASDKKRSFRNAFTGATIGRLTADQPSYRYSVDYDLRTALPILVARSRQLWQNNPYAKKIFRLLKTHVVGPYGITFKNAAIKPGTQDLDVAVNKQVVANVKEWATLGNCDVTGKLSWIDIQNLYLQTMAQDGEVLIREIKGFDNKWGYAIQFIDTDCLDISLNKVLPDGNVIKMGVELNAWNRPVAYWILQSHPGEYNQRTITKQWERIPAEQIIHDFEPERTNQTRGIPWLHASMVNLGMLGGALEAEVVAFRTAAAKMGLITEPPGEALEGDGEQNDDDTGNADSDYAMVFDAEAGSFIKLPRGYDVEMFDPKHPNSSVSEFSKTILKGVSSGAGPSYPSVASDLEGVNYTSIRAGFLDERDLYKYMQHSFLINRLHSRVMPNLIKMSMLSGALRLPLSQFDRIFQPKYQPRTWDWVDPLKEVAADVDEINAGLTTRTAEAAKRGLDFEEDILRVLQTEKKLMDKYGVTFDPVKPAASASAAAQDDTIPAVPGKGGNGNNGGNN